MKSAWEIFFFCVYLASAKYKANSCEITMESL